MKFTSGTGERLKTRFFSPCVALLDSCITNSRVTYRYQKDEKNERKKRLFRSLPNFRISNFVQIGIFLTQIFHGFKVHDHITCDSKVQRSYFLYILFPIEWEERARHARLRLRLNATYHFPVILAMMRKFTDLTVTEHLQMHLDWPLLKQLGPVTTTEDQILR